MNKNLKKGFTLVEVICAVAILSIVMIMFSSLFNNSIILSDNSQTIDASSAIAQSNIENNNGDIKDTMEVSFLFNDGRIITDTGDIVKSESGGVAYSVLVSSGTNFNDSGWGEGEVIGEHVTPTPTPVPTPTITPENKYFTVNFYRSYDDNDSKDYLLSSQSIIEGGKADLPSGEPDKLLLGYKYIKTNGSINNITDHTDIYFRYDSEDDIRYKILPYFKTTDSYKNNNSDNYYVYIQYHGEFTLSDITDSVDSTEFELDSYKYGNNKTFSLPLTNMTGGNRNVKVYFSKRLSTYNVKFTYEVDGSDYDYIKEYDEGTTSIDIPDPEDNKDGQVFDYWKYDSSNYSKSEVSDLFSSGISGSYDFVAYYKDVVTVDYPDACLYISNTIYKYYNDLGYFDDENGEFDYIKIEYQSNNTYIDIYYYNKYDSYIYWFWDYSSNVFEYNTKEVDCGG
jgi:prepilin-type N-terminal cleavage/methylation domain-containing protein